MNLQIQNRYYSSWGLCVCGQNQTQMVFWSQIQQMRQENLKQNIQNCTENLQSLHTFNCRIVLSLGLGFNTSFSAANHNQSSMSGWFVGLYWSLL